MAYWLSRLKALAESYASLIELTLAGSKHHKWDELLTTDVAVYAKNFFFVLIEYAHKDK